LCHDVPRLRHSASLGSVVLSHRVPLQKSGDRGVVARRSPEPPGRRPSPSRFCSAAACRASTTCGELGSVFRCIRCPPDGWMYTWIIGGGRFSTAVDSAVSRLTPARSRG